MPDVVVFEVIEEGATVDVIVDTPVISVGVVDDIVSIVTISAEGPPGEPGPPGEGFQVMGETPTGAINGVNKTFTTAQDYRSGSTAVYLNGLREFNYTESPPHTIVLDDAPSNLDAVRIDYIVAG